MSGPVHPARRMFDEGTTLEDLKAYMAPFAERLGYKFNTDTDFVNEVLESELEILAETGDVYCPCRVRTGDPKEDVKIVCPCIHFYLDQFSAIRKCWCGLFIRQDVEDGAALHGVLAEFRKGDIKARVASVDDLRDGEGRGFKIGKREIALFRVGNGFFALANVCRHMYGPLAEGYLDGHEVMCPWHGWRYDVRTGETDHPNANVQTYPVSVRGGEVFVTVSA